VRSFPLSLFSVVFIVLVSFLCEVQLFSSNGCCLLSVTVFRYHCLLGMTCSLQAFCGFSFGMEAVEAFGFLFIF
jgi:hypothetical protein